jgi:hypothetical protein
MSTYYVVTASRFRRRYGTGVFSRQVEQVPTFILNADIQGIVNAAHARRIARDIIGSDVIGDSVVAIEYKENR